MFKIKEQVLGLQHIPSTASAMPGLEEWLLPHLALHSLGLNLCGSQGLTPQAVSSSATASSEP